MKTITVSGRSKTLNDLLKIAQQTDLILQAADGEQFFLTRVTDAEAFYVGRDEEFDREIEATRQNKALMKFLDERGAKAKGHQGVPLADVKHQLGL